MLGYKLQGRIQSQKQIQKIKDRILAHVRLNVSDSSLYHSQMKARKSLKVKLDSLLKIGERIIIIKWSYNDSTFTSTAIATDKKGILYDPVGSNITLIRVKQP